MDETNFEKLKKFIAEEVGVNENEVTPGAKLYDDLGVYGGDAVELIVKYGKKFNVDVSKFMLADYFKGEAIDLVGDLVRLFTRKRSAPGLKTLTVHDLEKGILAEKLNEGVINNSGKYQHTKFDIVL